MKSSPMFTPHRGDERHGSADERGLSKFEEYKTPPLVPSRLYDIVEEEKIRAFAEERLTLESVTSHADATPRQKLEKGNGEREHRELRNSDVDDERLAMITMGETMADATDDEPQRLDRQRDKPVSLATAPCMRLDGVSPTPVLPQCNLQQSRFLVAAAAIETAAAAAAIPTVRKLMGIAYTFVNASAAVVARSTTVALRATVLGMPRRGKSRCSICVRSLVYDELAVCIIGPRVWRAPSFSLVLVNNMEYATWPLGFSFKPVVSLLKMIPRYVF